MPPKRLILFACVCWHLPLPSDEVYLLSSVYKGMPSLSRCCRFFPPFFPNFPRDREETKHLPKKKKKKKKSIYFCVPWLPTLLKSSKYLLVLKQRWQLFLQNYWRMRAKKKEAKVQVPAKEREKERKKEPTYGGLAALQKACFLSAWL